MSEVFLDTPRQQFSPIEFKGGKHNEISGFGDMFSGYLGDSKFVPWSRVYLGGYSFWGNSRYLGVNSGIQD